MEVNIMQISIAQNDWDVLLQEEFEKDYFKNLINRVNHEYRYKTIYPAYENIFNALKLTSYQDVKVVILGQDPYHGKDQAHGLSFSVHDNIVRPPSLNNIMKELYNDLGILKTNNDLTSWAREGVLLLNA